MYVNKKMPEKAKLQPKQAVIAKEKLPTTEEAIKQIAGLMTYTAELEDIQKEFGSKNKNLKSAFKAFRIFIKGSETLTAKYVEFYKLNSKLPESQFKLPISILKGFKRLKQLKQHLLKKYFPIVKQQRLIARRARSIEEARIKKEYKKTSIEKIKFRTWKKSDVTAFSKYVAENASTKINLTKLLKANPYLWNPKGNPDLYMQQQCVEAAILLLIQYCYKNHIDLALPASNSHIALSHYKTIEDFMSALYPKLSASHIYGDGGGIFTEISKKEAKAGDIMSIKHKKSGYHAQMLVGTFRGSKVTAFSGDQMNNDFREDSIVRRKVERIYPIGYIKTQPKVSPKNIKMHYGGYGTRPKIKSNDENFYLKGGDKIKYYRLDPDKLNRVLLKLSKKVI